MYIRVVITIAYISKLNIYKNSEHSFTVLNIEQHFSL